MDLLNETLPFLDPTQAVAVLVWYYKQGNEEVKEALDVMLTKYPSDWAVAELEGRSSSARTDLRSSGGGKDASWQYLLSVTILLHRAEMEPENAELTREAGSIDWTTVALKVVEIAETTDTKLAGGSRGMAVMSPARIQLERETMLQTVWLAYRAIWILLKGHLNVAKEGGMLGDVYDWLFSEHTVASISLLAPQLVRYMSALVIPLRKRSDLLRQFVTTLSNLQHKYSDPLTEFMINVYGNELDLSAAQDLIQPVGKLCRLDYFLCNANLYQHARGLVFDLYCRIHCRLSVNLIRKLDPDYDAHARPEYTEDTPPQWLKTLIADSKHNAKYSAGVVELSSPTFDATAIIYDRTRTIIYRTQNVLASLMVTS